MDSGDQSTPNAGSGVDGGSGGTGGSSQYGGYIVNPPDNCDMDDSLSAMNSDNNESDGGHSGKQYAALREQDRFLPIANVARIMKISIPKSGKIAKDAKECVQECVSEFVSFITSEASDRCHQEKRKTINGEDILFAMTSLGFDNYVAPLKLYLNKYREAQKGEKGAGTGSIDTNDPNDDSSLVVNHETSSFTTGGSGTTTATTEPLSFFIQTNNQVS